MGCGCCGERGRGGSRWLMCRYDGDGWWMIWRDRERERDSSKWVVDAVERWRGRGGSRWLMWRYDGDGWWMIWRDRERERDSSKWVVDAVERWRGRGGSRWLMWRYDGDGWWMIWRDRERGSEIVKIGLGMLWRDGEGEMDPGGCCGEMEIDRSRWIVDAVE